MLDNSNTHATCAEEWVNTGELHPFKVLASVGCISFTRRDREPRQQLVLGVGGQPSRFLWKQIAWEISEKAGKSGGSGGVSQANTTGCEQKLARQHRPAISDAITSQRVTL